MAKTKYVRTITAATILLLTLSSLAAFSSLQDLAAALGDTKDYATVSSSTYVASDNLLQFEWSQIQGDPSFTRFSTGPAPNEPNILWKTNVTGIQSYISAFNAKIFVTTKDTVIALDKETGEIAWSTVVPALGPWPEIFKIDNDHMIAGSSCLDPETGRILWTSTNFSGSAEPLFSANVYSPEEKMFYTKSNSYVQAWDFSNPSAPPTLAWATYVSGSGSVGSGIQYGDGKVFPGTFEAHQVALDAKTGKILWDTETKSAMSFSGSYYRGAFFRGSSYDNTLYAFNASDGEVLWTFSPKTDGYFCVGSAAAYGMVYELNKDGHLYALDVDTGEVVWKYKGPGPLMFPGNPIVADGKIYATTGQKESYTGEYGESEFACLDAYTGALVWKLPLEAFAPRESTAIAYGNLYIIPADVTKAVDSISGDEYSTVNQVWAIGTNTPVDSSPWSMWRRDPTHSASSPSGPTNLSLRWKFATSGAVVSSPSMAYGIAYFGSHDKNIYAVDARDGSFIWKFTTQNRISSSPAVVNGKVYTGADDGYIYCLDAYDGDLIWKTLVSGVTQASFAAAITLRSSPMVVEDRVYVGTLDTNVYALDANSGDIIWSFKTEGYITSSPAVVDGALYVTSQEPASGAIYKVDANEGHLVWKQKVPYNQGFMKGTDMHGSPTVGGGLVFVSSNTAAYYAVNATTGDIAWEYKNPNAGEFIICSTIYEDGQLFLIDKFSIVNVDTSDGHTIWSAYLGEELYISPSYAGGKLYVVTDQRSIFVLNATNGEKLGRFVTDSNSWSAPSIYEGKVYVGNNDWNVYCLAESILPSPSASPTPTLSPFNTVTPVPTRMPVDFGTELVAVLVASLAGVGVIALVAFVAVRMRKMYLKKN